VKQTSAIVNKLVFVFLIFIIITATQNSVQADSSPFMGETVFDKDIPSPESVLGFAPGSRAVTYDQLVKYLAVLDQAGDRIKMTEYGKTHEGRILYYLIITSRENHKRLDRIKADNARLADPRKLKDAAEADKIIAFLPAVAFLNYGIHGDELSSSDAAMYIAYHLAAAKDKTIDKLLDEVVVIMIPMTNPDGRERFLGQIRQMTGSVDNSDVQAMHHQALWSRGRGNHYLFDMNRDWLVQLQPEVRATASLILGWNPHLLVDSHEQGPYDNYLFDPPNDPVNSQLSASILKWRSSFGADQGKAFNKFGWSYYTKDWYSDWGPLYTNAWASLLGSAGLLYEQARADSASVKQPTGQILDYRSTVHHQIVSTFANLNTLVDNRRQILKEFYEDRKWAVSDEENEFFIIPPDKDTVRRQGLIDLLKRNGIEIEFAQSDFEAEKSADFWGNKSERKQFGKGTAVIKCSQPHRRLLECLLDFDVRLSDKFLLRERTEITNHRPGLIYDVTAWNPAIAFDLDACWVKNISSVTLTKDNKPAQATKLTKKAGFGYIIDFADSGIYPVLARLFEQKCCIRAATKPFKFDGKDYKRGALLLRSNENPDNLFEILQKINADCNIEIISADTALVEDGPDFGTSKFALLAEPRIAIASQWPVSSTSFGSVWFLLDNQIKLKTSPFNIQNIGEIDLRTYNVIILPDSGGLKGALDKEAVGKIKQWVENGGTLIAIAGSAAFVAEANSPLSAVRLREDVLDKLPEYRESLVRERQALNIKIDSNSLWADTIEKIIPEPNKTIAQNPDEKSKDNIEKLKRDDQWNSLFSPTGVFLAGSLDPEQYLSFGLNEKLPLFYEGKDVFMAKHPVRTAVRLAEQNHLRLGGLLWPEAKARIADSAFATIESLGNGQVILFAADPTFRMWLSAEQRLFLNACLLGPGLGTTQPRPW
jgi:hypothetical protein